MKIKNIIIISMILLFILSVYLYADRTKYTEKLNDAALLFKNTMRNTEQMIPPELIKKCKAIVIFPEVIKAGFMIGGRYGEGVMLVKGEQTSWNAPAFFTITGGSFGLQIGVQSIDVILLIMTKKGLDALLEEEFTIGGDASVTAGPRGAKVEADIDILLKANIITYAAAKGLFAGVSIKGSDIGFSEKINKKFYNKKYKVNDFLIENKVPLPKEAEKLTGLLKKY